MNEHDILNYCMVGICLNNLSVRQNYIGRFKLKQPEFLGNHLWLDRLKNINVIDCVSFKE